MQGREHSKWMSKSKTELQNPQSEYMGNRHGMGRLGEAQAYRVPRMESRVKVRMENRKVMDMK